MFFSLVQTLVCVLLINGGLYALHLQGNGNDASNPAEPLLLPGLTNSQAQIVSNSRSASEHAHHTGGGYKQSSAGAYANAGRLNEELADLAQLERERLMLLGIVKQTAVANAAAATGHHGRPIITGRIHMSPTDDVIAEGELEDILMPPPPLHGYMFGHVVKQPVRQSDGLDFSASEFAGGGTGSASSNDGVEQRSAGKNYEYGRIVKPDVVPEYDTHQMPLDLDAFMELDAEPKSDEDDFDFDSYQYLDDLLADQPHEWKPEKSHHRPNNPYQNFEKIEEGGRAGTPLELRELFNKEQQNAANKQKNHQQQKLQQEQHSYLAGMRNGYNPSNIRLQQKWLRKRAQQQQQPHHSQRNIFDQKNHLLRTESIAAQQPQPHFFNQRHNSFLPIVNSEATANKNNNNNNRAKISNVMEQNMKSATATMNTRNHNSNQLEELQEQQQNENLEKQKSSLSSVSSLSSSSVSKNSDYINNSKPDTKQNTSVTSSNSNAENSHQQQPQELEVEKKQQDDLILHPNHKRSGMGSSLLPPVLSAAGSHSMASQLMLRTARGQRQYDVPQIGKSSKFFTY